MMKKSFLILLCVLLTMTLVFAACGKDDKVEDPHTHTYATTWSSDATGHWYATTCGHTDVKANNAAHVDENNDGICDVCAYESCTHTYAETWSTDETNHWYASTCGHAVTKDKGAHVDENKDGLCDTCAYVVCEHTYEGKWSTNETNHWHAATCGCDVKKDDAAHVGMEDSICDVCGYGDHEHTWSEYKSDETGHWKESTCTSHGVIRSEEGAHTNEETNDGICDVCSYVTCTHTYEEKLSYNKDGHFNAVTCGCDVPVNNFAAHDQNGEDLACSVCGYVPHEDTYADEWSSDAKNHWHASTCGCVSTSDNAPHTGMEDGICDVCGYGQHDHTWSEEYKNDADNHWYESTCEGHDVIKNNVGAHVDINNDGVCDVCYYVSCTHEFDETKWESDARGHWYATTCGHDVKGSYALHDDKGEDDSCSVCGYSTFVSKAIENAISAADKVSSGTVYSNEMFDDFEVTYEFGKNYTHVVDAGSENTYEYWTHLLDNGKIFSLRNQIYDGNSYGASRYTEASESNMLGREFSLYFVDYSLGSAYGVEDFIYQIYEYAMMSANASGELIEYMDETTRTYAFSFACISGDANNGKLQIVTVAFVLSENDVIVSAIIGCDVYMNPTGDPENTANKDYIMYEDGSVQLLESAIADKSYSYIITQTEGERVAVSPYNLDEILIQDLTVTDAEGNSISSLELGQYSTLYISGITPTTANLDFDTPTFSITVDGVEQWVYGYFDTFSNSYSFTPSMAGEWELIVKTTMCEKTIEFTVAAPETTSLTPMVNGSQTTSVTSYVGVELTLSAIAPNDYADRNFIPTCDSANVTFAEVETSDATWTFSATEVGTYVITLTSTANPGVTATLTVEVLEAPDISDILVGKYEGGYMDDNWNQYTISAEFVPETDGALNGTMNVTLSVQDGWTYATTTYAAAYTYEYVDGVISTTFVSGDELPVEYTFAIGNSLNICVSFTNMWGQIETVDLDSDGGSNGGGDNDDTITLTGEWKDSTNSYIIYFYANGETSSIMDLDTYAVVSFYYSLDDWGYLVFDIQYDGGIDGFDNFAFGVPSDGEIVIYLSDDTMLTFTPND